mgnify:CR=1 FL=1
MNDRQDARNDRFSFFVYILLVIIWPPCTCVYEYVDHRR